MLALEEILCELNGDDMNEQGLPPGFRFHPTDEELITFYLATKVYHGSFCGIEIAEVDLNRCEPWELPDTAKMGKKEWYFFSLRDRKYPTGLRTNRATGAGYWKATGKDKEVYSASNGALLGMKKTLVFYKGRAPRGEKTKWVMHEYRLDGDFSYRHTCKEEWVICRIVHKSGEKKTQLYQSQSYHLMREAAAAAGSSGLPPLLEIPTPFKSQSHASNLMDSMHNPFQIHHHENDLKSLINPALSQSNHFPTNGFLQPSFSPLPPFHKNTNPLPSHLFKSLLSSHQAFTSPTVPKQCKTEPNFSTSSSHFQLPDANLRWMDKIHHQNPFQNPLFLDVDSTGVLGFSAADTPGPDFQMMLDPASITVTGDSWPLDL